MHNLGLIASLNAFLDNLGQKWVGSVVANAPDCKSGTLETPLVRVQPYPRKSVEQMKVYSKLVSPSYRL